MRLCLEERNAWRTCCPYHQGHRYSIVPYVYMTYTQNVDVCTQCKGPRHHEYLMSVKIWYCSVCGFKWMVFIVIFIILHGESNMAKGCMVTLHSQRYHGR